METGAAVFIRFQDQYCSLRVGAAGLLGEHELPAWVVSKQSHPCPSLLKALMI